MKTAFLNLAGIALGVAAGFLVKPDAASWFSVIAEAVSRVGRYFLFPLVFFSFPVAVTRLRRLGCLGSTLIRSVFMTVLASLLFAVLGVLIAWTPLMGRVPVVPSLHPGVDIPAFADLIRAVINFNGFHSVSGDPSFLMPVVVLAFILGWHFHHDREIAEPAYNVFDSLSRILYRANRFLLILMPVLLAFIAVETTRRIRGIVDFRSFLPFLAVLLAVTAVLIGGVFPLIIWLIDGRKSPWKTAAGLFGALIGAFASASLLFNYGNLTFHFKENWKIPRHTAAFLTPFHLMFSRAGTAMLTAICMLTVIRSYSSLEITFFQMAWTALFAFLTSFALLAAPDRGLVMALVILSGLYRRGLDEGWLILAPILPILMMLAVMLDTAVSAVLILLSHRRNTLGENI